MKIEEKILDFKEGLQREEKRLTAEAKRLIRTLENYPLTSSAHKEFNEQKRYLQIYEESKDIYIEQIMSTVQGITKIIKTLENIKSEQLERMRVIIGDEETERLFPEA